MSDATSRTGLRRYRVALVISLLIVVFLIVNNWSLPYVIHGPGSAEPVHDRVQTGKELDEKGAFLFTTISSYAKPNLFSLAYARLNPRMDILPEEEATGGTVNYEAYRNRNRWMMESSEASALLAAYREMGQTLPVENVGVIVYQITGESQADENGLQEGDILTAIDGKPALSMEQVIAALADKKAGDRVKVVGTRAGKPLEATVPLIELEPDKRAGLGIIQQPVIKVTPPDPVQFDFSDTGGPSAGLMMTLEIVAQLTGEDLTRGYRIAGTGTIAADGSVGQIGGIRYKLMAADREQADYFLVPYVEANGFGNWKEAEAVVAELGLSPRLVPVSSLRDALDFLKELPPK